MTKQARHEIALQIKAEGIDIFQVSIPAVQAYRVAFFEKSGEKLEFIQAVREMYGKESDEDMEWLRQDMEMECRA